MVNVPSGVWIDEEGRIVRPPEVAYSKGRKLMGQKLGDDRYALGLKDWVERGPKSAFVMGKEKLSERLVRRSMRQRRAAEHFMLGAWFQAQKERKLSRKHWKRAQQLDPENWNYHRQDWSFDGASAGFKFLRKVSKLRGKPYYRPLDLPPAKETAPKKSREAREPL